MTAAFTDKVAVPRHVGIIMDGNGRWAKARQKQRLFGHQAGVRNVRQIVRDVADLGVEVLTLYSFSTENWARPKMEINMLFNLLSEYVHEDLCKLQQENVRVCIWGRRDQLPLHILDLLDDVEQSTAKNSGFVLNIAFNYGGRDEIIRAVQKLIHAGISADQINERLFETFLDSVSVTDVDLIIRTGGEKRISNFLLWQAAYAELVFTDVLWPDFTRTDLQAALREFGKRERRYGCLMTNESSP